MTEQPATQSFPTISTTSPGLSTVPASSVDSEANRDLRARLAETFPAPAVQLSELEMPVDIFLSGINGALTRQPRMEIISADLVTNVEVNSRWKPHVPKLPTFKLVFPEGIEFVPAKPESESKDKGRLRSLKAPEEIAAGADQKKKQTRLKPPSDALSIQDRLFYLLQPPIENWLNGQELVMPFEPFDYQYEGIAWLFSRKSALLADEMGLGKTMQTITAMRLLLRSGQISKVLLICPKPLIPNWQREFATWAEELPITTVMGETARRRMIWEMDKPGIYLANYEAMARDFEEMEEEGVSPKFDLLVLDEAQRIKNRESRTAVVARSVNRKRSWALTGTPIENRAEELASLFEFMEVIPPRGTPDIRQLSKLSDEYILRRCKDLVLDMPPRLDRPAWLDLEGAQLHAYKVAEKEGIVQLNDLGDSITVQHVFELVLRLKQIANFDPVTNESAKLDRLKADMEEIAASGGKAILFSQWTKTLDWIADRTQEFNPLIYHGGVPTKKREPILAKFKEDPDAHLILMSYGTGAVGLNLQFAGYVFLYDRWWNPAIEDQAINRAHRIGQKNPVVVTKFVCNNTIEEKIDRTLQEKRDLFISILGAEGNTESSMGLNAGEIFDLFDLKARDGDTTREIGPESAAA
ncbi:ATP-dependent helicase HepA [Polystyrenella longa]|uniref:ATP-dependent helicase HepA n=1 Tax=Polystyrenella longa TaxID=2528007 RepID=A0A518CPD1_9PLAN|nr:DEAD/DEAH box helicase [Polystyrenella longa]QDU81080.1 ATP-dependent helicase HepA [Polystyrenella longa]